MHTPPLAVAPAGGASRGAPSPQVATAALGTLLGTTQAPSTHVKSHDSSTTHIASGPHPNPFRTVDWQHVARTEHPGGHGVAYWRTLEVGNVRVRLVEYGPGYRANHWCERGHVVHVLDGELVTELRDGRRFVLATGESYVVADGDGAHRSSSRDGARLLIVD